MAQKKTAEALGIVEGQEADGTTESAPWEVIGEAASQVEVYQGPAPSQWRRKLTGPELLLYVKSLVRMDEDGEEVVGLEIFDRIAQAGTVDEILGGGTTTTKLAGIEGIGLECRDIRFMPSDKPGCPYFAVCDVRRTDTGERDTVSLGGWKVIAQLASIHYLATELSIGSPYVTTEDARDARQRDPLPAFFKVEVTEQRDGNTMNHLVPLMR